MWSLIKRPIEKEKRKKYLQLLILTMKAMLLASHKKDSSVLGKEWKESIHPKVGIGCIECHTANEGALDA